MTTVSKITYLLSEVLMAIDNNRVRVSLEEMRDTLQNGRLFQFFARYRDEWDISLLDREDREYLSRNLKDMALALEGRERRKFGVEYNGLCLLVGYLNELVQRSLVRGQEARDVADQ
jgi:hypothetical protein